MLQGKFRYLFVVSAFLGLSPCAYAERQTVQAIAMYGAPKYEKGFAHFGYANPNAPQEGMLRLGVVGTFDSLNPFIVRGSPPQPPGFALQGAVYEPLMARSWDEPFSLYGLLAESVEVPDDRSSITFHLNPKAHWQDGQAVTADDVLFSFEILRDKGRPNHRTYYKKVAKAEKLDMQSVRFTFVREPDGKVDREMPLIMGLMPVLPRHDWQDREFNQTTLRLPTGSGPYKVVKAEPGRTLIYERDPNYWGRDVPAQQGLYNFDTVRFDFFRDDGVALQAFKAGAFDVRREPDPNKWATAYDHPAVRDGRIVLEETMHSRTEATAGFVFNTRRPLLKDRVLRVALDLAFDFGWINRTLFHGFYRRTESFFPNSELAATGIPEGREKEILEKSHNRLPADVFTTPAAQPETNGDPETLRKNLRMATAILKKAGYFFRDEQLYAPDGTAVAFEIMLGDPLEEKVALAWTHALRRLGIVARIRTVDSAQYQARLSSFDYDVTTARWFNSLSPGNEQLFYWGSAAADQPGCRNYAGVRNPVVDALAAAIPEAKTRDELVATTRALDRVLLYGHYIVPFYYLGADLIASWASRLNHPTVTPIYGPILEAWWAKP